jgi:hypothetical protein
MGMILIMALASELIPDTSSPSKTFGVHHVQVGTSDVNDLVNLKTGKAVTRLKGFSGFDGENHGGVVAAYNKSETIAAVMHAGKWEPRALSLVNTASGNQLSMLKRVQTDSKAFYVSKAKSKKQTGIVFQVGGGKFVGEWISFWTIGEIPKNENVAPVYQSVSYPCKVAKGEFVLGKPKFRSLGVKDNFGWPKDVE